MHEHCLERKKQQHLFCCCYAVAAAEHAPHALVVLKLTSILALKNERSVLESGLGYKLEQR